MGDLPGERRSDRIHPPPQLGDRTLPIQQFRIREPSHRRHRKRCRGITESGELINDLAVADLERRTSADTGGIAIPAITSALRGGVGRVHVIDGRTPHSLIAELFTDRGVGTLVTP